MMMFLPYLLQAKGILSSVIRFFSTPVGQVVAVILLVLVAGMYGKHLGKAEVRAAWKAANIAADLEKKKFEAKIQSRVDEIESVKNAALEKQQTEFLKKLADYEAELKKRPDARCTAGSDDVKRMRDLLKR